MRNAMNVMYKFLCAAMAFVMILTSSSGLVNAAAADVPITHGNATVVKEPGYEDTKSYVAKNAKKELMSGKASRSAVAVSKDSLKQTDYSIRLKQLIAEKSKIPADCTINELWGKHSDAFISQYTTLVPLYATGKDAGYYIADLSAAKVNGTGSIYDAAFVRGTDNKNPDVLKDIQFDKKTGLAYIPKSYFDKDENVLITGQAMYAGSIKDQETDMDVTVKNPNTGSKEKHYRVTGNTYDVTVKVPVTESLRIARGLNLSDLSVYINGSETAYDLNAEEAAAFNQDSGELELAVSPATVKSIRVEIRKDKLSKKIMKLFTTDVSAKITNPDKLKFATDKKTGDPIVLDKVDTSKLQDGQVFDYKTVIRYFSDKDASLKDDTDKAMMESIKHSVQYLYIPTGSANTGWFDIYDKGSDFDDADGVNLKTNFEDVTFGMTLPNKELHDYKVTASNKNKATLNFHQKGQFVTKYDDGVSYSAKHMYAGECAHITNPMGTFKDGDDGTVRLSVLHVDTDNGYVIIGMNTQEINTQSGFGIYKLAIESKGAVKIKKTSANPVISNGNSCYSYDGAQFGVYSDSACTKKVMTLTANAKGETDAKEIDAGKYYVKETKAPKGYELNEKTFAVTVDTDNDEDNPAVVTIADEPGTDPAYLEVNKVDKETGKPVTQGDASLSGAQFTVNYYNSYYDNVDKLPNNATKTWVLETKERTYNGIKQCYIDFSDSCKVSGDDFYKDGNKIVIPYGSMTITETKAPEGMKIEDSEVSINGAVLPSRTFFSKVEPGKDLGTVAANFTVKDPTKNYGIQVWKYDKELSKKAENLGPRSVLTSGSEAIGGKDHTNSPDGATLEGTQFSIINRSQKSIHYDGKDIEPGEEVMKVSTSWNAELKKYTAQTDNKALPYGTYGVKEVKSSQGYLLTDGEERTVVCHGEDGHMYTPDDMEGLKFSNQVIRGDYNFVKKSEDQKYISAAFKVTNTTTKECHVIVTDKNGKYDSRKKAHSAETNANDALLDGYNEKTVIKTSELNQNAGTWFGLGEDGSMADVNDKLSAFPYGKYEVEELRCEENQGLKLVKFSFYVEENEYLVDGGTVTDDKTEKGPSIHTTAKDIATDSHVSSATEDAAIRDTVTYENFEKGETVKFVGVIMDKATGNTVTGKDGKDITAEKTVKLASDNGTVDVDFEFDATKLAGKDIVIFETAYDKDGNIIATHKDIEDEGQTIKFPELKTKATDTETNGNTSNADETIVIKDTVTYKNLPVGKTFTVKGTLMDKETGKPMKDDNGDVITAFTKFKAEKPDGTVEVTFTFSGVKCAGKTGVVFEDLVYQNKTYATHADINDEPQTIRFPELKTQATDTETNGNISNADETIEIKDTVAYKNVTAGKTFTLKGILMDQETGKPMKDDKGNDITASAEFTAESESGTAEVIFKFSGVKCAGKTGVVFEELYQEGKLYATHADIKDEPQTIYFPKLKTTATDKADGDHQADASRKITIVDRIEYSNLKAGETYKAIGVLTDKKTGKPFLADGKEVTAEKEFTAEKPDGYVDVEFTFHVDLKDDMDVVVFETAYDSNGKIVAEHKDIKDEGQTVRLTKKPVKTPKKASTPSTHGTPKGTDVAKTGQKSFAILGIMALLAAMGLGVIVYRKKKDSSEE